MRKIAGSAIAAVMILAGNVTAHGADCSLKMDAPFAIDGLSNFSKNKYRKELSGLVCGPGSGEPGTATCLLVQDEGLEFSAGVLKNRHLGLRHTGKLPADSPDDEFDAEAAAVFDGSFFVAGSHGQKAKSCKDNSAAFQVARFRLDGEGQMLGAAEVSGQLAHLLQSLAAVKSSYGQCLGTVDPDGKKGDWTPAQGINIEGMAAKGGRLYFGFRGPVPDSGAVVAAVTIEALFDANGAAANLVPFALDLGQNHGIRDIAAAGDGFLILSGSQDDVDGAPALFRWAGDNRPAVRLCDLPLSGIKGHPEALAVLPAADGNIHVVLLSDGPDGGAPVEIVLPP